jgi:hypothetical protein
LPLKTRPKSLADWKIVLRVHDGVGVYIMFTSKVNTPGFGAENEKPNIQFDLILPVANVLVYLNHQTYR